MSDKLFYRLTQGLKTGEFYSVDVSPYDVIDDLNSDWYKSVYLYTEQQVNAAQEMIEVVNKKSGETYKRKRGIAKLVGTDGTKYGVVPGTTNRLIWDFDSDVDPELAKQDLIKLLDRLEKYGISKDDVSMVYSGSKGYHAVVNTDTFFNSTEMKSMALSIAKDLPTVDAKVYNDSRVLRVPHTKHQKSGRYCTPVYSEDLALRMDEIIELSTQQFTPDETVITITLPEEVVALKNEIIRVEKRIVESVGVSFDDMKGAISGLDFTKKLPNMQAAKWVLHMGFIPQGHGQDARMILAATYKSMMMGETDAYRLLKSVSERRVEVSGDESFAFDADELWTNVIATVYSPLWQGGNYGITHPLLAAIDELLPPYLKFNRGTSSAVINKKEAFSRFKNYAKNVDKNTIKFGIPSLDRNMRFMTKNVYGLLAPPGAGKSSIALQILENTSRDNNKSMFFSFDMSLDDTVAKILVRHTNKSEEQILEEIKTDDTNELAEKYEGILTKYYDNTDFVFNPGMTVENMERALIQQEETTGVQTKLIVVDYLSLIKSEGKDAISKAENAIQGLRGIAHTYNLAVFVLLQPNKMNANPDQPIKSYNGIKGTSTIAEVCTAILTAYRAGFDPESFENDKYLSIICVKNRKGRLFSLDYHWDGKRGQIRELQQAERNDLTQLREMKKEEQATKKQFSGGSW